MVCILQCVTLFTSNRTRMWNYRLAQCILLLNFKSIRRIWKEKSASHAYLTTHRLYDHFCPKPVSTFSKKKKKTPQH